MTAQPRKYCKVLKGELLSQSKRNKTVWAFAKVYAEHVGAKCLDRYNQNAYKGSLMGITYSRHRKQLSAIVFSSRIAHTHSLLSPILFAMHWIR